MTELEEKIKNYADNYYSGNELISDSEYDALIERLKKEQPDSVLLGDVIGSDLKGVSKKYRLEATMGTLEKCNTDEQMKSWWNKHSHNDISCQLKIDGNGQLLTYKNGNLQYTRSRGDGEYGEDTTANVSKVNGVPKCLPVDFSGCIRGEVLMKRSVFEQYFKDGKNPRNMASGIIKRLDGKDCDKLNFIAYDVFDDNETVDNTETDKLNFLASVGFEVPENKSNLTLEELKAWKDNLNPNGEIPCDGIVIKQNKVDRDDLARHTPMNNIAYKPNIQHASTVIKDIIWDMKGSVMAPVAIVEPVELEGATVERATLSNINIMNDLGVYVGADIIMSRHGMIIPSIDKVLNPKTNAFTVPSICPACNGILIINESGFPECGNEDCSRKLAHRYKRMFDVFGIKGAGDAFVDKLEYEGIMVGDFLEIVSNNDVKTFNRWAGGINGEKILIQMKNVFKREITPAEFLATFDVKFFDVKRLNFFGNKTLDELLNLSYNDVIKVNGFADITANAYIDFITKYRNEIDNIRKYFNINIKEEIMNSGEKGIVVFTGTGPMKRSELSAKATAAGWTVGDSVNSKTNLLVCADPNSGSSKLVKAAKNGTKIMSYDDFIATL